MAIMKMPKNLFSIFSKIF